MRENVRKVLENKKFIVSYRNKKITKRILSLENLREIQEKFEIVKRKRYEIFLKEFQVIIIIIIIFFFVKMLDHLTPRRGRIYT